MVLALPLHELLLDQSTACLKVIGGRPSFRLRTFTFFSFFLSRARRLRTFWRLRSYAFFATVYVLLFFSRMALLNSLQQDGPSFRLRFASMPVSVPALTCGVRKRSLTSSEKNRRKIIISKDINTCLRKRE